MSDKFFSVPPVVDLIADPALPAAGEVLPLVAAELARFELTSETPTLATREAARERARMAAHRGCRALVVAGGDASFAGELAGVTGLPVLRVPVGKTPGDALKSLWPETSAEVPADGTHATFAIGEAGARNAALFVVAVLALTDRKLQERWREFRRAQTQAVLAATLPST